MFSVLLSLGILFLLALIAGRLCARVRIPRVTGYLLVGLAGGPSLADLLGFTPLIAQQQLEVLEPLHDLALGLIVLVIGGHFHFNTIRKFGSGLCKLSALEMGGHRGPGRRGHARRRSIRARRRLSGDHGDHHRSGGDTDGDTGVRI